MVEINYTGDAGANKAAMDEAFLAFEAESRALHEKDPRHPIYRVINGQSASRDQTADPTRFLVSVAGGQPPDLILFDRYAVSEWAARGAFTKLDPFLAREATERAIRTPFGRKIITAPAGRKWFTPTRSRASAAPTACRSGSMIAPFFITRICSSAAALSMPRAKRARRKTWDELAEMAVKLTERNARGAITRLGFAPNYGNAWLYLYAWMNGGRFMTPDRRQVTLNEPPVVEALQWMTRVYDSLGGAAAVYAFQSSAQTGQLDPFLQGKVAMKIDGYWSFPEALAQFGANLNYGVAAPPLPAKAVAAGRPAHELGQRLVFRHSLDRAEQGRRLGVAEISLQPARRGRDRARRTGCSSAARAWSMSRRKVRTARSTSGFTRNMSPAIRPSRPRCATACGC